MESRAAKAVIYIQLPTNSAARCGKKGKFYGKVGGSTANRFRFRDRRRVSTSLRPRNFRCEDHARHNVR